MRVSATHIAQIAVFFLIFFFFLISQILHSPLCTSLRVMSVGFHPLTYSVMFVSLVRWPQYTPKIDLQGKTTSEVIRISLAFFVKNWTL